MDNQGDVIWSTTQESGGGKFRGAMADVADKITRQLVGDVNKARAALAQDVAHAKREAGPANAPSPGNQDSADPEPAPAASK